MSPRPSRAKWGELPEDSSWVGHRVLTRVLVFTPKCQSSGG